MKKVRVNATQVRCITIDVYVDVESNASEEKKRKAAIDEEEEAENERDRYIEGLKKLPVYAAIEILAGLLGYKHLVHNPVIYATIVETAARLYPRTWTTYLDKVIDSYTK